MSGNNAEIVAPGSGALCTSPVLDGPRRTRRDSIDLPGNGRGGDEADVRAAGNIVSAIDA
ncbi:MAG: hypothetical protein WCQ48_05970 [Chloroflexota bacterium]